jgi:ribosomal protein S18 acetylase RimI-like enzyme
MADYTIDPIDLPGSFNEAIIVRNFEPQDTRFVQHMIMSLYTEDNSIVTMDKVKINKTIAALKSDPKKGSVLILQYHSKIIGYSILINYWSNEYGGNITNIDELYVLPEFRRKGIATAFFSRLFTRKINNSVVFQLEVTPKNKSALKLYQRIGFKPTRNKYYRYIPD